MPLHPQAGADPRPRPGPRVLLEPPRASRCEDWKRVAPDRRGSDRTLVKSLPFPTYGWNLSLLTLLSQYPRA